MSSVVSAIRKSGTWPHKANPVYPVTRLADLQRDSQKPFQRLRYPFLLLLRAAGPAATSAQSWASAPTVLPMPPGSARSCPRPARRDAGSRWASGTRFTRGRRRSPARTPLHGDTLALRSGVHRTSGLAHTPSRYRSRAASRTEPRMCCKPISRVPWTKQCRQSRRSPCR